MFPETTDFSRCVVHKSNAKQKTSSQAYARSLVPKEAAQIGNLSPISKNH